MPRSSASHAGTGPVRYRIDVRGPIGDRLLGLLEAATVEEGESVTSIWCAVVDQAQLQAVLAWLYEDGLEILSVESVAERPAE